MPQNDSDQTIPLWQERLDLSKVEAVTDRVSVTTHIAEQKVVVEDNLLRGNLTVERVAVERPVAQAPEPRQEGDTLIVSVVEERLVVEKRLFVMEEIRITRTSTTEHIVIPETVRTMRATVERADASLTTGN